METPNLPVATASIIKPDIELQQVPTLTPIETATPCPAPVSSPAPVPSQIPAETVLPAVIKEVPTAKPEETSFNWTRDEILFGPNAGFEKARNGETLTVWADPVLGLDADKIIAPWNDTAGWNLFSVAVSKETADIGFVEGDVIKVEPKPDYYSDYTECVVFFNPNKLWLQAAEERIKTA